MPSINMIAANRAEKKRLEKWVCIVGLVILSELALTVLMLGFMTTCVYSAGRQSKRLDGELVKIEPTVQKIRSYELEIKALEPRRNLLADSREQTLLWYTVLGNLSHSLPENTWLKSISATKPETVGSSDNAVSPVLNITGTSVSQRLVGETMLRLNQFPEFQKVDLTYTRGGTGDRENTLDFQISAQIRPITKQKGGTSIDAKN